MVSTSQLLAFALASLILIVIPGPSVLFVVGRALAHGRRTALASVLGNAVGVEVVAICVALGVGAANPKAVILFAAVLPGFVNRQAGDVPVQMILLSLVSFAIALASDSAWSLVASTARLWSGRSPRRLELVGGAGGLAMIGLGISVAATGRKN